MEEDWRTQLDEVRRMSRVLMRNWPCVCGRYHKYWWKTTQAPSCTVIRQTKAKVK